MRKILFGLMLCVLCTPAFAASYIQPPLRMGNFYAGGGFGVALPLDSKTTFSGAITGSGDMEYNGGSFFSGLAGVHLTEFLAVEAEFNYSETEYEGVSGTLTGGGLGTGTGLIGVNGQNTAILGMGNLLLSPFGRNGFSPYLGVGVGFANMESDIDTLSFNGLTGAVNAKDSKTSMALAGIAGVDYVLGRQLSLGGRYRYLWIDSGTSPEGNGIVTNLEDFTAHVMTVQVSYRF